MSSRKRSNKPYGGQITTATPPWLEPIETHAPSDLSNPSTVAPGLKIALSEIHLPSSQPRHYFDPQALSELVESVRQHGILQPLLVRPRTPGGYELVAGERRYRAATEVGLSEVPVVVRELSDDQAFQLALIENLQREDLNPVEETEGVLTLLALKLQCDIEEVKSLLYRMKNALDKESREATHTDTGFRKNVSPNSPEAQEESRKNDSPNSLATQSEKSRKNVSPNSPETQSEESRKNDSPNSLETQSEESRKNVSPNSSAAQGESRKNVSPNSPETQGGESRKNVFPNESEADFTVVQEVFDSLGQMNWLSFTTSRLPLLNLPEDLLEVLRSGQIAYTKALLLARVKDPEKRQPLLESALANNWSVSQIKESLKALGSEKSPQSPNSPPQLPERLKQTYQQIKKRRIWEDPKKRKQLETLLAKLETLLGET